MKKSTRASPLYKNMVKAFINNLQKDWRWRAIFVAHKIYRENFHQLFIYLPFVTQTATDDTIFRTIVCPHYLRVFRQNYKKVTMNFPHYILTTPFDEPAIGIYCKIGIKKPKHLAKFGEDWGRIRKYGVLTKQKYKNFYVKNPDVYEVLVYEEIKQRSLEYYTEFVGKIIRQYVLRVFKK